MVDKKITLRKKIELDPLNGELWYEYADLLDERLEEPIEIVKAFETAQKYLPNKDIRVRLGSAYANAGDVQKGIDHISMSLEENPRSYGYCILADILIKEDRIDDAILACDKAIVLDPNNEEAFYLRGEAYSRICRDKAINDFRKATEIDPEYQLSWQALGRELIADKKTIDEGIHALQKSLDLSPDDGWALVLMANAFWRKDDLIKAEIYYKKAIDAYPNYNKFQDFYEEFKKKTGK